MERSRLVSKKIIIKNPNWEFSMDGDISNLSEDEKRETETDINEMMDELYTVLTAIDLLSKSKWCLIGWFEEVACWDLEWQIEDILIDTKWESR